MDDGRARAARMLARSPYAMPRADAITHITERRRRLLDGAPASKPVALSPPDADFASPEPMPVLDQPERFAADFWAKRRLPGADDEPPMPKPQKPRGRPVAAGKPGHERFRIVDGDKQG